MFWSSMEGSMLLDGRCRVKPMDKYRNESMFFCHFKNESVFFIVFETTPSNLIIAGTPNEGFYSFSL